MAIKRLAEGLVIGAVTLASFTSPVRAQTETQKVVHCPTILPENRLVYTMHHPLSGVSITIDRNNSASAYVDVTFDPKQLRSEAKVIELEANIPNQNQQFQILVGASNLDQHTTIVLANRRINGEMTNRDQAPTYATDMQTQRQMRRLCFNDEGFVKFSNTDANNPASIEP